MSYLHSRALSRLRSVSRIVVIDATTLREVRRIEFEEPGEQIGGGGVQFFSPMIAISPDGMKLALLWKTALYDHQDKLEVFPLTQR